MNHLFDAIDGYNHLLESARRTVEDIELSRRALSGHFVHIDQWSPNANHLYVQYRKRMKALDEGREEAEDEFKERLENALASIDATVDSISSLAGAVLQIGKQILSLRYAGKPNIGGARRIGSQSIVEVIWEGRNHAMHWEEGTPRQRVKDMLNALSSDLGIAIDFGQNNSLVILEALGWKTASDFIADLMDLIA
jgi:hypothetical protein